MPTDPDLTLRPADGSDADLVAEVHLASRRAAPMPPGVHTDDDVRHWLAGRLTQDTVWLAERAGDPVGYARFTDTWLDDLYVVPTAARRGVGSALLDLVKAHRSAGFCLWVFEMNTPARAFYRRHGLVELERTDGSANEERAPDLRLAWPGHDPVAFFRGLIDEVDTDLGDLLNRRAALTRAVQDHKPSTNRDPAREREIVEALALRAPTLGEERLTRIVHAIITESLEASAG
ncbi:GNAT family N-acetyltransferase [Nocardioides anomalus]|uniref:GNAT family N-acetyltransferase n=1 Tax=Nocardioides anomalus TaxID=2712223 RepID=A0A6G6WC32_9ACTN|nr:GNAT family N-acetyltransferase [Nocardioides anomalus]QIG42600.1 GNAT family N-acetyltransferase [Nocardioides anomalus]